MSPRAINSRMKALRRSGKYPARPVRPSRAGRGRPLRQRHFLCAKDVRCGRAPAALQCLLRGSKAPVERNNGTRETRGPLNSAGYRFCAWRPPAGILHLLVVVGACCVGDDCRLPKLLGRGNQKTPRVVRANPRLNLDQPGLEFVFSNSSPVKPRRRQDSSVDVHKVGTAVCE